MSRLRLAAILPVLTVALFRGTAGAQIVTPPQPPGSSTVRLGPVRLNPSITFRDVGTDDNVFNQPTDPKRDFMATLIPEVDAWLRLGRGRLQAKAGAEVVYFEHYASERTASTDTQVTFDMRLGRLTPYVTDRFRNTRQRVNLEIDARAHRLENVGAVGTSVRLTRKTTAAFEAHRSRVEFDPGAEFRGIILREVLNRTEEGYSATGRYALTPYTTFSVGADTQSTHFAFSPARDTKSVRVGAGVEFNPRAWLNGTAYVGQQRFEVLAPSSPDFHGTVASVDVAHTIRGSTRLALHVERSLMYSFELNDPYYVMTGWGGSITRRIASGWDVHASATRDQLGYQNIAPAAPVLDRLWLASTGVGSRLGRDVRVEMNVEYQRRQSPIEVRNYERLRITSSAAYTF